MYNNTSSEFISKIIYEPPYASAIVKGNELYPNIKGTVYFYEILHGAWVLADISGLPELTNCKRNFFGFHIHEGKNCDDSKSHFNPTNDDHPCHAGDLPVLLSNQGHAWTIFYTNAFTPDRIADRTVIIHDMPDDYRTQPAGAAGNKIACGRIIPYSCQICST